jgi:membrane fusion protein, multidrug efflux system
VPSPAIFKARALASIVASGLTFGLSVGVGAVLLGCGDAEPSPAAQGEAPPAPVEVATAEAGELVDQWVFVGEVRSLRSAELAVGAAGEIISLAVREGDRVVAGELLVEIDQRRASAQLSAAVSSRRESERELVQARREAERAAKLGASIISSEEIEQQQVRAETLEARKRRLAAEIRAAKAQLSEYQLLAPFDGVIAARYADLGQWLDPGETVIELVAVDAVEILVEVRPELAPHVRVGDKVTVTPAGGLRAVSDAVQRVEAEVTGVVPSLDKTTRTFKIRLTPIVADPAGPSSIWLLPGAPVQVAFPVTFATTSVVSSEAGSASVSAVLVPRDALVLGAVDTRVVVVVDGAAKPVLVEVRAMANDMALITGEGLTPGSVVVTRGNERLRPGQRVRVIDAGPQPGAGEGSKS